MKYLVLIYGKPGDTWLPEPDPALSELTALRDELVASGELVSAEGLQFPAQGRVVRIRAGQRLVTDGPFIETKEQLAGFFMISVADDERALQIAGRVSAVVGDRVELRGTLVSA